MLPRSLTCLPVLGAFLLLAALPARAQVVITPTWDSSITSDPNGATIMATIDSALAVYASTFSTPLSVTITFTETNTGLGENLTYAGVAQYSDYVSLLQASATSANDFVALAHLPLQLNNPVTNTTGVILSLPNARALGFIGADAPSGQTDSTIELNTALMNLSRSGAQNPSKYDLFTVVSHEIDEVLGLGSALNISSANNPNNYIRPQDLYRYDASGNRSYTTSSGATAYFSLDGTTDLVQFNQTGSADYGDWATSGTHRVQDAFGTPGAQLNLSPVEITALDTIGYTLTSAPEPGTWALLLLGGAGLVFVRRRRNLR
jgi:hypothetical protein